MAVSDTGIDETFDRECPDCWERAADLLDWGIEYDTAFRGGDAPPFEWFPGGKLNPSVTCLDRHLPERNQDIRTHDL